MCDTMHSFKNNHNSQLMLEHHCGEWVGLDSFFILFFYLFHGVLYGGMMIDFSCLIFISEAKEKISLNIRHQP